jgi:SnoaL-like domain
MAMVSAGEILKQFYDAAIARDLARARTYLADDLVFVGLFETYRSADDYIATFTGLLQITVRLKVMTIIAEADQAAIFFELATKAPAEGVVLVAEWHQIKNGKIAHVESAFDGRPFAAMFTGGQS